MKKKLIFFTCCILCMFLLTACGGAAASDEMYGSYTADDLEMRAESLADELTAMSAEDILQAQLYYQMYGSQEEDGEMLAQLLTDWGDVVNSCGEYSGYGDFSVVKSGKTVTATLPIHFSKRDAELVFVYNAFDMELTAINVNMIYSLGETMQKAGLNTIMGILTVFVILVLISLLISCFKVIPMIEAKLSAGQEQPVEASPETLEEVRAQEAEADDRELIAVIAAAIAASTGTSTDSFVVRSIRRI